MINRPLPPLNALRAFEATARLGGVGRAAQELHVTHGAVSRQIKLLEADVAAVLLQREGRGVRLTEAGHVLHAACREAFGRLHEAVDAVRRPVRSAALVLGCSSSVLARWMIPRLPRLQAALPAVHVHWSALDGSFSEEQAQLDAVLLLAEPPWPSGWQVIELAPERVGAVISPRHPAAQRLQGQPSAALLPEAVLHTMSRPQAWPAWAEAQGLDPQAIQLGQGFDHLYYLLEAAVAGLGVAIAPQPLVAEDVASSRLLAPWGFTATGGMWVLARPRGRQDARVDALATWLQGQLAETL